MPATRFRGLGRAAGRAVLLATVGLILLFLHLSLRYQPPAPASSAAGSDMEVYRRVVGRLQAGESYYPALHDELLAGGYGTRSVFNWRLPFYLWFLSRFPGLAWAEAGIAALALVAAGLTVRLFQGTAGRPATVVLGVMLGSSLVSCFAGDPVLFSEVTCGVLILLSASAYGLGRTGAGFVAAVAALLVRELAAPYALLCLGLAWREHRRREVGAWVAMFLLYALYVWWHAGMVTARLGPLDRAYPSHWLQWGGLSFVLATAQVNGIFFALPLWVTALVLPLGVLGLAAWPGPAGTRAALTVGAYLALFFALGKPFNTYWGPLYTPFLALGLAWAPAALADLVRTADPGIAGPAASDPTGPADPSPED